MLPEKICGLLAGTGLLLSVFLGNRDAASFCVIAASVMGAVSFLVRYGAGKDDASLPQSMLYLQHYLQNADAFSLPGERVQWRWSRR